MAEKTGIAWTDHTFNPWWGCMKVSPGCAHCYAETFSSRYGHDVWGPAKTTDRRTFGAKHWAEPLTWNLGAKHNGPNGRRRRVFCGSMCDVFEDHPTANAERAKLWSLIRETTWLDWQLLTKRPENIAGMLPADWGQGYPNVWLGTSVEDQPRADERIPRLLNVPARIHFLSCEPLLGPVSLLPFFELWHEEVNVYPDGFSPLDWVIVGGESGPGFRAMELDWLRGIVNDCRATSGVSVFVKQDSAFRNEQRGRIPDDLWIREFPESRAALSEQRRSPEDG